MQNSHLKVVKSPRLDAEEKAALDYLTALISAHEATQEREAIAADYLHSMEPCKNDEK